MRPKVFVYIKVLHPPHPVLQSPKPARATRKAKSRERESERKMSGVGPISQDWEPVVIRKKAPNAAAKKDEKAVNAARRSPLRRRDRNPQKRSAFPFLPSSIFLSFFLYQKKICIFKVTEAILISYRFIDCKF